MRPSSEVMIASPYFIPGPLGMKMMRKDARTRIRIVVVTNALGATDEPLVHWRYARYRRELLRLGVEIYELSPSLARESGGFGDFGKSFGRLHAKVAVIDRKRLFVGSLNLDQRSAWSNTESGLLIDSPALAAGHRQPRRRRWQQERLSAAPGGRRRDDRVGRDRRRRQRARRSRRAATTAGGCA